jgi:hypothetical protein
MGEAGLGGILAGFSGGDGGFDEGLEVVPIGFQLERIEGAVAGFVIDGLEVFAVFELAPDFELVIELVAGELELLAAVFVLDEADEDGGREVRIMKAFEGAEGDEVAGPVEELGC